jgi:glycosyltransferase involved in cell wall biosynthesis
MWLDTLRATERGFIRMPSLHICTITFDKFPFEGRSLRQVEAAIRAGHQVDVICPRQGQDEKFEIYRDIHIYRLPIRRSYEGSSFLSSIYLWCWFLLLAAVKVTHLHFKNRFDVVHVHNMPDFLVFAALVPRLLGTKIILDVQDVSPELMAAKSQGKGWLRTILIGFAKWQERISVGFSHHVVTTGKPFEQILLKRGVPKQKITEIHNSADPQHFPEELRCPLPFDSSSNEDRPFIFMYHGTLTKRKGLDKAIRALAIARQCVPQLRLDIQGNGEELSFLKELAATLGVSDSVIFTEMCPAYKVVKFVIHGDAGIIPSECNGFEEYVLPTKAYEFVWMHRPVIASDTYAIRSMFRPESISLCDPEQPESFAQAMIDLYRNAEKRSNMIANAFEDYLPFRGEVMVERYQQLLLSLCGK